MCKFPPEPHRILPVTGQPVATPMPGIVSSYRTSEWEGGIFLLREDAIKMIVAGDKYSWAWWPFYGTEDRGQFTPFYGPSNPALPDSPQAGAHKTPPQIPE